MHISSAVATTGALVAATAASLMGTGVLTAQAASFRVAPVAPHAVRGWVGSPTKGAKLDSRCFSKGAVICISKEAHRLYFLKDGKLVDDFSVRTGRPSLPTRSGDFKVYMKGVNWHSTLYDVNMPYSMFFSGGEAVHYSADFAAYGYSHGGSHGCANVRDLAGAKMMFNATPIGSRVVVW